MPDKDDREFYLNYFADIENKIIENRKRSKEYRIDYAFKEKEKQHWEAAVEIQRQRSRQESLVKKLEAEKEVEKKKVVLPDLRRNREMLVWYPRTHADDNGYADQTVGVGVISFQNIQDLLARFFIQTHFQHGAIPNWRRNCIGISNAYFDGLLANHYMPVLDYDGRNVRTQIRKDVKAAQKEYGLGDAWVYETKRGFHVYFFCDTLSKAQYFNLLLATHCCEGFKQHTQNRGYAVVRVSAKYTNFDIRPLYVLSSRVKQEQPRRMTQKAHLIRGLLKLGEDCGTHFASLFPQWANYQEDSAPWKPPAPRKNNKRGGKRIRKIREEMESWGERKKEAVKAIKALEAQHVISDLEWQPQITIDNIAQKIDNNIVQKVEISPSAAAPISRGTDKWYTIGTTSSSTGGHFEYTYGPYGSNNEDSGDTSGR